jgi:NAD+ synthase (glutamine-hydrolysing)
VRLIRVGAGVVNTTPLDWDGNRDKVLAAIEQARAREVSILCLPELVISGYGCEDMFHSGAVLEMARCVLHEIVPHTQGMIVTLGLPVLHRSGVFNAAATLCDGRVLGLVAKQFLSGDGIHYEPRWFKPWPAGEVSSVDLGDHEVPIGDIHFDCGGVRIGFEICEDAWVAGRPGGELSRKAVDVILNPSASHFAFAKIDVRERLVLEGSRAFGVTYVYTNLVGNEAGRAIYDGGALIASHGVLLAAGPRLCFSDLHVTEAVIDVDATRLRQSRITGFRPDVEHAGKRITCPFVFPPVEPQAPGSHRAAWERSAERKKEEFTRAEALALFDYLRKARARGFVVSLSGGCDSTAVACLVRLMVELGTAELGHQAFIDKLGSPPRCEGVMHVADLVHALLTCAYQATENSSQATADAARQVAEAIGAEFISFDVDPFFKGYVTMVSEAEGRSITWERDDVPMQNIQARVRAPGVWMLANLRGALLLCTSNRSEAAVGYATMDGDTCGGLSPLAGINKAFLREWLLWLEHEGPQGLAAIPALEVVNAQAPTAELKPAQQGQTDEGDLMPYELLDAIERCVVRDKQSPVETYIQMRAAHPSYDREQMLTWIERFFRLWCTNQWKRERYAPSFHLDDENLDPKSWCRFPILSGGFERELAQLRARVREELERC